jgi:DNA-3-methyladenine glycosylase
MKSPKPLPRKFYMPSAEVVASELLGHWLLRQTPNGFCGGAIVETEAYVKGDRACHAFGGITPRTRVMFGEPGHAYVYFIYGNHYCINAVCRPIGEAEAVLIRAVEANFGEALMRENRRVDLPRQLTSGPGKLCEAMAIDRSLDGEDLCQAGSTVLIAENPEVAQFRKRAGPVVKTTRVGITQAAALPFRFYLSGSDFVSRRESTKVKRSRNSG